MLIAILILRNLITALRELGLTTVLPLDNNIYLHKVVGYLIFVQAWIHSIMHLCNFCEFNYHNVAMLRSKSESPVLPLYLQTLTFSQIQSSSCS